MSTDLWAKADDVPNRQIDYMYDAGKTAKAGYAMGYLPVFDGEPKTRAQKTSCANYLYRSGKAYPVFLNNYGFTQTGTKNQIIKGVGYKNM